jgi:hypothetical protein
MAGLPPAAAQAASDATPPVWDYQGSTSGSPGLDLSLASLREAIAVKAALLVEGVCVDPSVGFAGDAYKPRIEQMYRHHVESPGAYRIPQDIVLFAPPNLTATEVIAAQLRHSSSSRWRLRYDEGALLLTSDDAQHRVAFLARPRFYHYQTPTGVPVWQLVQLVGTDLVGIVPSNYCSFFAAGDECRFCELVPGYQADREYQSSIKPDALQIDALEIALRDTKQGYLAFTTGNYDDANLKTVFHLEHVMRAIAHLAGDFTTYAFLMSPRDFTLLDGLHTAGFDCIGLNLEVWNSNLFPFAVPGKHRHLGRDGFLSALEHCVDVFGPGKVYSNFVYGIQSLERSLAADTFDPERENELCLEASASLLEMGVVPLFTIYHYGGFNRVGQIEVDTRCLLAFSEEHGRLVADSGLVPDSNNAAIYGLGSIPNHFYNDLYYLAKVERVSRGLG